MEANEQARFDTLYAQHLRTLKLRGYSASTIDVYARAVRGLTEHFDCVPDQLSIEQLEIYFAKLVDSHSWATVRVDRNGFKVAHVCSEEVGGGLPPCRSWRASAEILVTLPLPGRGQ